MSMTLILRQEESPKWISGPDLWRAGFTYQALSLISWMNGLVEVLAVEYDGQGGVLFYVRSIDKTRTLFRAGSLRANPVFKFRKPPQPLMVEAKHLPSFRVLN